MTNQVLSLDNHSILGPDNTLDNTSLALILSPYYHHLKNKKEQARHDLPCKSFSSREESSTDSGRERGGMLREKLRYPLSRSSIFESASEPLSSPSFASTSARCKRNALLLEPYKSPSNRTYKRAAPRNSGTTLAGRQRRGGGQVTGEDGRDDLRRDLTPGAAAAQVHRRVLHLSPPHGRLADSRLMGPHR